MVCCLVGILDCAVLLCFSLDFQGVGDSFWDDLKLNHFLEFGPYESKIIT